VAAPQGAPGPLRGVILSDVNLQNLAGHLENDAAFPPVSVRVAPFGQIAQTILGGDPALFGAADGDAGKAGEAGADFAVLWTSPAGVIEGFRELTEHRDVPPERLDEEVDAFVALAARLCERARIVFVPLWIAPAWDRGLGLLELRAGSGAGHALLRMNLRLAEACAKVPGLQVLNAPRWAAAAGPDALDPKSWYLGKIPFSAALFRTAAAEIKSALRSVLGGARKILLVDLDNTLWGGIVGDVGWENLRLGGHDPIGEAHVTLQRSLKALTRRGFLLGIVSKNEEDVAREAIRRHPAMVLREDDFAGWRINWDDKAKNVVELMEELNLGLQSAIFIDDQKVERERVRTSLPEVLVPEWPESPLLYDQALRALPALDGAAAASREDEGRAQMYISERRRRDAAKTAGSLDDWIASLNLEVRAERLGPANLVRAAQLLNKTNQMNLSTRRLADAELLAWAGRAGNAFWTFDVTDRFGEYGITGLLGVSLENGHARIVDYVLSCRVMGRKVEETMLHVAAAHAARNRAGDLVAEYLPTPKNKPCLTFLQGSGMTSAAGSNVFRWPAGRDYDLPAAVRLVLTEAAP
jgi:FkbH-like protein